MKNARRLSIILHYVNHFYTHPAQLGPFWTDEPEKQPWKEGAARNSAPYFRININDVLKGYALKGKAP